MKGLFIADTGSTRAIWSWVPTTSPELFDSLPASLGLVSGMEYHDESRCWYFIANDVYPSPIITYSAGSGFGDPVFLNGRNLKGLTRKNATHLYTLHSGDGTSSNPHSLQEIDVDDFSITTVRTLENISDYVDILNTSSGTLLAVDGSNDRLIEIPTDQASSVINRGSFPSGLDELFGIYEDSTGINVVDTSGNRAIINPANASDTSGSYGLVTGTFPSTMYSPVVVNAGRIREPLVEYLLPDESEITGFDAVEIGGSGNSFEKIEKMEVGEDVIFDLSVPEELTAKPVSRDLGNDFSLDSGIWHNGFSVGTHVWLINDSTSTAYSYLHDDTSSPFLTAASGNDLDLGAGNWTGGVSIGDRVWIVDDSTNHARGYTHSNGTLTSESANDLALGSGRWTHGFSFGDNVWFINDEDDEAVAYTHSGGTLTRSSGNDENLEYGAWAGGFSLDDDLWLIDDISNKAVHYTHSGGTLTRASDDDLNLGLDSWRGAVSFGDETAWIINDSFSFSERTIAYSKNS